MSVEATTRLYVIDTSSIIEPRRLLSSERAREKGRVYSALGDLVDVGELMFPPQVLDELERFHDDDDKEDRAYQWAKTHDGASMGDVSAEQLFEAVRAVQEVVSDLVDFTKPSPGDDADPYVVGLALHFAKMGYRVTVVSEDRKDRAEKTSIQSACAMLELPALGLRAFLKLKGIWPRG